MALVPLEVWSVVVSTLVLVGLKFVLIFWAVVILCTLYFAISSFLCYADQQRNMFVGKSMKKMLRQTFSVFEPEQCLEMGNYKYSF